MSERRRPVRWRVVAAAALGAAAIVLCGALVAIATGGTESGGAGAVTDLTGSFTDGITGQLTSGGFLTDSAATGAGAIEGAGARRNRAVSALWTGVGIGAIVVLVGGCAALLRRSRPPEATDEGPDFWASDSDATDEEPT